VVSRRKYGLHTAATHLPRSDHIVFFHLLTDGSCKARLVNGNEEVEVAAGDLLLFPHDHLHLLGSDLMLSPTPVGSVAIEGLSARPTCGSCNPASQPLRSGAERFTEMIGSPPIRYLTQWRLTLAAAGAALL
jgi:hypothetical protein